MSVPLSPPLLELRSISRSFGGVQALSEVDLELPVGEVHAIVGENGAGKSTLVKILTGVHQPDSGEILVAGEAQPIRDAHAAQVLGIAAVYQEPSVFLDLSVAENIYAGRRPRGRLGSVDWPRMNKEAGAVLQELGVDFGSDTPVRGLGVADRQLLEIAKALSTDARLLIMDEPTAALSPREVDNLFRVVRDLRERGVAVVFISHRLEEVTAIWTSSPSFATAAMWRPARRAISPTRRSCDSWSADRSRRSFPRRKRRSGTWRSSYGALPATACSRTSRSPFAAERSSASPAWSAPGAARSRAASSGSTPTTAVRSSSTGRRFDRARRARPCVGASPTSPRTGWARGSSR